MILFFGDSITSAENNNFDGYVEKMELKDYKNYGVSGTCIADCSLYPVEDNNLIQLLYKKKDEIKKADKIFLEYGSNDISSIIVGYTTLKAVMIEFVKCVDFIRQTNPSCGIYFITLGDNINSFANGQINYLKNDYFKSIKDLLFTKVDVLNEWIETYNRFVSYIKNMDLNLVDIPALDSYEFDLDDIHPNDKGYLKIAVEIKKLLN